MTQLTTLDAGFRNAEDADRHVSPAVGDLAVIAGPVPDHDSLMATVARRTRAYPRLGQRPRLRPFDLGAPEWVDDPGFDLAHHVRRVALPRLGGDPELFGLVADVLSRRWDRDRPLWEIWVVDGLADNRWAMLTKVHQRMADGTAATPLLAGLCDNGVGDSPARHIRAAEEPKPQGPLGVSSVLGELWNASGAIAARMAWRAAEVAAGLLRPPTSSPNGPGIKLRRYSAARVPLADVRQVCRTFGVTFNEVALAAVTESYRGMLFQRGEQPTPDSLRASVPMSTDALPYLPIEEQNPVQRLRMVQARLDPTKSVSLANRVPFPLTAWLARPLRGDVVTLTTNASDLRQPLHFLGQPVLDVLPVPPVATQSRIGMTMLSYAGDLFFGIMADYDAVVDIDELARGIEVAVARLVARSKRRKPPCDRRGLSLVLGV